jgi:hypothetical protein
MKSTIPLERHHTDQEEPRRKMLLTKKANLMKVFIQQNMGLIEGIQL